LSNAFRGFGEPHGGDSTATVGGKMGNSPPPVKSLPVSM
jgi:hypothetical protein